MSYTNSIIFGPIPSRRFGISLGIDLSPGKKQCNYDCLYCELEAAPTVETMDEYPSVEEIIKEIKTNLLKHDRIDVLTLTANGEPTLYPKLDELINEINKIKKDTKTLILSNGSTIYDDSIYNTLLKIDTVKLSLDCVSEKSFKKLDRFHKGIDIEKIIKYMSKFSKETKNLFVLEILFVKSINDKKEEIELLYKAVKEINPARVDIGTIDRPPAYNIKPVPFETLENVAKTFEGINVNIAYKNRPVQELSFSEEDILSLLPRRPLTKEDIKNTFSKESQIHLAKLLNENKINLVNSSGVDFYKVL